MLVIKPSDRVKVSVYPDGCGPKLDNFSEKISLLLKSYPRYSPDGCGPKLDNFNEKISLLLKSYPRYSPMIWSKT